MKAEATILEIKAHYKKKDYAIVYLDNDEWFTCHTEIIMGRYLKKGKKIEIEQLKSMIEENEFLKCKSDALKYLEKAYKTVAQVEEKLIDKEYENHIINKTLKFLEEYRFVDDNRYCKLYVKENIGKKGMQKIKYELTNKGINKEIIERELDGMGSKEEEGAIKIAKKRVHIIAKREQNYMKIKQKLYSYMSSKGYTSGAISEAMNIAMKEVEEELKANEEENNEDGLSEFIELAKKRKAYLERVERDDTKRKRKLYDYLLRRGVSYDNVKGIVDNLENF